MKTYLFLFVVGAGIWACTEEAAAPKCQNVIKADLSSTVLKIDQIDDHHFFVTAEVANLSRGECAETSGDNFGTLKIYFGSDPTVNEADQLVVEKTFAISPLVPNEKRVIKEPVNLYETGYYLFAWTVDHQQIIDETNESNNAIQRTHFKQY